MGVDTSALQDYSVSGKVRKDRWLTTGDRRIDNAGVPSGSQDNSIEPSDRSGSTPNAYAGNLWSVAIMAGDCGWVSVGEVDGRPSVRVGVETKIQDGWARWLLKRSICGECQGQGVCAG